MNTIKNNTNLFSSIKKLIEDAKIQITRKVNTTITLTYYQIGKVIIEDEQNGKYRADYAKEILAKLSKQLTKEFGKGYSQTNLEYIRKFYKIYINRIPQPLIGKSEKLIKASQNNIPQSLVEESYSAFKLSWTHYIQLIKIENIDERNFYEIEAAQGNWSVRELHRQYNSSLFERLALSKNKKGVIELAQKGQIIEKTTDALKHHTVLEFLDLKEYEAYTENDLENAIINKIEQFMLELGKGFLFEGRQKRFTLEGDNYFVDLILYNRLLKCYVIIDLKIGKLTHQDIGQMQMYVNYYDRKIKLAQENPTIGIIICKEENKTVIEFTLPENNKPIFAKEYKLYLPSKDQLKKQLEM